MKNFYFKIVISISLFLLIGHSSLLAHCQIPCGIYNDHMRIEMLEEHITTIEKSMNQITELSKAGDKNYNQLVRWINNKEIHAQKFQDIVTAYFLTQRIKPVGMDEADAYKAYSEKTVALHQMLVYAMKTKQTTDLENCKKLRELIDTFSKMYFSAEDLKHLKEHK